MSALLQENVTSLLQYGAAAKLKPAVGSSLDQFRKIGGVTLEFVDLSVSVACNTLRTARNSDLLRRRLIVQALSLVTDKWNEGILSS